MKTSRISVGILSASCRLVMCGFGGVLSNLRAVALARRSASSGV
jgi:hypothetical protein